MKKNLLNALWAAGALVLVTGCASESLVDENNLTAGSKTAIGFTVNKKNMTKADDPLAVTGNDDFGVFGYNSIGDNPFDNVQVTNVDKDAAGPGDGHWDYTIGGETNKVYWDYSADSYAFYAYAPYSATAPAFDKTTETITLTGLTDKMDAETPAVYKEPIAAKAHVEFADFGNWVNLKFHRLNGKIKVAFAESLSHYYVEIVSCKLVAPHYATANLAYTYTNNTLEITGSEVDDAINFTIPTAADINNVAVAAPRPCENLYYFLPYDTARDYNIVVEYNVKADADGTVVGATRTATCSVTDKTWEPNQYITYIVHFKNKGNEPIIFADPTVDDYDEETQELEVFVKP